MPNVPPERIQPQSLDDYLAVMSKAVFQSGMSWRVVDAIGPATPSLHLGPVAGRAYVLMWGAEISKQLRNPPAARPEWLTKYIYQKIF